MIVSQERNHSDDRFKMNIYIQTIRWNLILYKECLKNFFRELANYPTFFREAHTLRRQLVTDGSPWLIRNMPLLLEKPSAGGMNSGRGHYFFQDLWAARHIYRANPKRHVDVGSRVDGFIAHVAVFREIEMIDIRPVDEIENVKSLVADFMQPNMPYEAICDSASSLSVIEHFGLGRYGDPIDVNGAMKGMINLHRLLKPGGTLYFSVPIGPLSIVFNAHRIFSLDYLLNEMFQGRFTLDEFSFVDDAGFLHENIPLTDDVIRTNAGCSFGCGLFKLIKI